MLNAYSNTYINHFKTYMQIATCMGIRSDSHIINQINEALEGGFPRDFVDNDGWTLLHWVAATESKTLCQMLIDLDFDINARDFHGYTPFAVNLYRRAGWNAKVLLNAGCDWRIPNYEGETPLEIFRRRMTIPGELRGLRYSAAEIEAEIREFESYVRGHGIQTPIADPASYRRIGREERREIPSVLLHSEKELCFYKFIWDMIYKEDDDEQNTLTLLRDVTAAGFPVTFKNKAKNGTLLHNTAQWRKPKSCRFLIELGADVNAQTKEKETPFYRACFWEGGIESAKVLIDAGADWTIPDHTGDLPLDALECHWKEFGKDMRTELEEYIALHLSQVRSASELEEPAYQQEL